MSQKCFHRRNHRLKKMSSQVRSHWGQGEVKYVDKLGWGESSSGEASEIFKLGFEGSRQGTSLIYGCTWGNHFCTEEIGLSSSPSPSSYISPHAVRKNSLVVNVCYFRRHSVLLADVPNAWALLQIFEERVGAMSANLPWNGLGRGGYRCRPTDLQISRDYC